MNIILNKYEDGEIIKINYECIENVLLIIQ